jgi:hypothetical protein
MPANLKPFIKTTPEKIDKTLYRERHKKMHNQTAITNGKPSNMLLNIFHTTSRALRQAFFKYQMSFSN